MRRSSLCITLFLLLHFPPAISGFSKRDSRPRISPVFSTLPLTLNHAAEKQIEILDMNEHASHEKALHKAIKRYQHEMALQRQKTTRKQKGK